MGFQNQLIICLGDIINLADRFSTEANITGMYLPYYDEADFLVTMGKTEGIKWYDKLHNKVLFDSSLWRELLQKDISLYRNILKHQIGGNLSDSFLNGNVAMTLNTYQFARELSNNANKSNWGIVTEPVSVNEPENK